MSAIRVAGGEETRSCPSGHESEPFAVPPLSRAESIKELMAESEKGTVPIQELLISTLAQSDTLPKLLIEKGLITKEEYLEKIRKRTSDVSAV
jgi:hypothetical protein